MQTKELQRINPKKYELLLAAVISARATSFIFSKMILEDMGAFNLLTVRFLISFSLLMLIFHREIRKMTKQTLISGVVVGALFFITMAFEMLALKQAASSLVSLLENAAIIFVPAFEFILFRKVPGKLTVISSMLAMLGVVLLAVQQGQLKGGFTFGLLAGVSYALAIIVTERLSHGSDSSLGIGIVQVGTMGILSFFFTLCFEQPHLPVSIEQWMMLALLILVCTGFGFTLQPVAQSHVSAERAGLFCAISPAIAALLGVVVLQEELGVLGGVGLVLILGSIVLPYILNKNVKSP